MKFIGLKKLITAIILSLTVLSLASCSGGNFSKVDANGVSEKAKEYGYFHYKNCDFGITPAEMLSKMNMKSSDFTVTEPSEDSHAYTAKLKLGKDEYVTTISFVKPLTAKDEYLSDVTVKIPSQGKTAEDIKNIVDDYLKDFGDIYNINPVKSTESGSDGQTSYNIITKKDLNSVPNDLKDKYNKIVRNMYEKKVLTVVPGATSADAYKTADFYNISAIGGSPDGRSISYITVSPKTYEDEGGNCYHVTFRSPIASVLGYINVLG